MHTIDETTDRDDHRGDRARAAGGPAGVPTIPLPRRSAHAARDRPARPAGHRRAGRGQHRRRRAAARARAPGPGRSRARRPGCTCTCRASADGDVVGVLTSDAVRLPLGCVLFRPSTGRPLVSSTATAEVGGGRVVVGDLAVSAAAWWDPRPRLPSARPALLPEGVRQLRTTLYGDGVPHSAFELPGLPTGPGGPLAALRGAVRRADLDAALRTATRLIGMGPGLDPGRGRRHGGHRGRARAARAPGRPALRRRGHRARRLPHHRALPGGAAARRGRPGQQRVRRRAARPRRGAAARTRGGRPADAGSTGSRATALGLCTAIDLVERTMRVR